MQQSSSSKTRVSNSNVNSTELRAVSPSSRQARKRGHNVSSQETGTTEPPSKRATRGSTGMPAHKSHASASDLIQIKSEVGGDEAEKNQTQDSLDDSSVVTFDESLNEVSQL